MPEAAAPQSTAPTTAPAAPPAPTTPAAPEATSAPAADDGYALLPAAERLVKTKKKVSDATKAAPGTDVAKSASGEPIKAAEAEAGPVDADKERTERKARIEALQAKEREKLAKNDQRKARQPQAQAPTIADDEVRIPKARAAELAEIERALGSEEDFLTMAEKRGLTPDKLATHIRERLTNPERIAGRQAERAVGAMEQRLLAEMRRRDEAHAQEIAELRARDQQRDEARVVAEHNATFVSHVREHSRVAPLTARYLERHGQEKFLQFATQLAEYVPPGSGPQAVQDLIEQTLEDLQLGHTEPSPSAKPKAAAVQANTATTVTNTLASQTTEVPDEDAYALLPPAERLRIAKKRTG